MSVKSIIRVSVAVLALLGLAGHAGQRGAAAASQQTPTPAASPAAAPTAAPAPSAAPGKDPLLEFVPSEHVPADSSVSFPVDI